MNKKFLLILAVGIVAFLLFSFLRAEAFLHDGKLHVVFCDVGQGDAVFIKSPQGRVIIFDGGPDDGLVNCLGRYLPFWGTDIDLMIVSHPHLDHFVGAITALQKYSVHRFATEALSSDQLAYQLLLTALKDKRVQIQTLRLGDTYSVGELMLQTVGPTEQLLARSSPNGQIEESAEFASLLMVLRYESFSLVLSGDSQLSEMREAVSGFGLRDITILQAPHHGSKTGLDEEVVATLGPEMAVFSVGEANRYGHPSPSILSIFQRQHIPIKRTDQEGDIEIISNGSSYRVVTHR